LVIPVLLNASPVQANVESILTVDKLFTALNTGEMDVALAAFATDAVVENQVRGETHRGAAEIEPMLQAMQHEGRRFDIVRVEMVGNTVTVAVEISDRGQMWGTETITAEVSEGKVQKLSVSAIQLKLWRCPGDRVPANQSL
jgi:limonene-1,2-epoxide hydrolase